MLETTQIPPLDAAALGFFVLMLIVYRVTLRASVSRRRSIMGVMLPHRVNWMLNMARRDNRLMDAILLGNLSQGNAFFASTSAIAIGGLVTVLGYGDTARGFLEHIPYAAGMPPLVWEFKVLFLMSIFVYSFFKFAWAFRLTHYSAVLIGATPILGTVSEEELLAHARRTGELNSIMADHAANGLSAFYFAIAALAWFYHPLLFMAATAWVVAVLMRRDLFSRSRDAIAGLTL